VEHAVGVEELRRDVQVVRSTAVGGATTGDVELFGERTDAGARRPRVRQPGTDRTCPVEQAPALGIVERVDRRDELCVDVSLSHASLAARGPSR